MDDVVELLFEVARMLHQKLNKMRSLLRMQQDKKIELNLSRLTTMGEIGFYVAHDY